MTTSLILTKDLIDSDLAPGRYRDGGNLFLRVSKSGGKSWSFVWKDNGTVNEVGLGSYTGRGGIAVNLKQARMAADRIRVKIYDGINPLAERKDARATAKVAKLAKQYTFEVLMQEKVASLKASEGWKVKDGICEQEVEWTRSLTSHAGKLLKLPMTKVDTAVVVDVLKAIWKDKAETAERVRYRIEKIWDLGKAKGLCSGDNPARYDGHIEEHCGKRPTKKKKGERGDKSHAAMPDAELVSFFAKLIAQKGNAAQSLAFLMLTAVRTDEARLAQWSEIDLEAGVWTIPADRMKAGREHKVPLSTEALALLTAMPRVEGNDYVFFGNEAGKPLGATALADKLCKPEAKGGFNYRGVATVHGMRSCFADWISEETSTDAETREHCLAHVLDATVEAYRRKTAVEKRRKVMQAWANHLSGKGGASVVSLAA